MHDNDIWFYKLECEASTETEGSSVRIIREAKKREATRRVQ